MTAKNKKSYVIAEMACSHDGKPELAKVIIDGAAKAGAQAIQFQVWERGNIIVPQHPANELLEKIELSQKDWTGLLDYVRSNYPEMHIIACVYDRGSVDFCESINVDAFKIHSADLSNPYLITYVAEKNKRIDLSVGASTLEEIEKAISWINKVSSSEIWLMYGYQSFPTPTDAIHLKFMATLSEKFNLSIGYQDHSDANYGAAYWLPAAAIGMGINIIEKHITHDRSLKGVDHEAALNPNEFVDFMNMVNEIDLAKGTEEERAFSEEEIKYRKYSKKSIVASRNLEKDQKISESDILFLRAEELGLPPDNAYKLIGKKARKNIEPYAIIVEKDLQ